MFELVKMWALVEIAGLLALPLTVTVFHNLPDRGWAFSKSFGMALFAFCVWLPLMCFQMLPYSQLFLLGVAVFLLACSAVGYWRAHQAVIKVIRSNRIYVIVSEVVFLGMVLLLGTLRQFRPDIRSWETFMDEGLISGIMRSPHLPPNDIWYSGFSINYYYYAHFMIASFGKLISQPPSIVFNTGISIFFALTALNLFGLSSNVVGWAMHIRMRIRQRPGEDQLQKVKPQAVISEPYVQEAGLLGTVDVSSAQEAVGGGPASKEQLQETVAESSAREDKPQEAVSGSHAREDKPQEAVDVSFAQEDEPLEAASESYPILTRAIPFGLSSMVMGVIFGNLASAFQWWSNLKTGTVYDWFAPSRVIPATINEFPAFSFLLSDFHAHVLTLGFTVLAMGVAFNFFLESDGLGLNAFGRGIQIPFTLVASALCLGQLFAMNGWDLPTYLGLSLLAIAMQQWLSYGRRFRLAFLIDVLSAFLCLIVLSFFLFLPFYLNYRVPTGGIGVVLANDRTAFHYELFIYSFFLFVFVSLLAVSAWRRPLFVKRDDDDRLDLRTLFWYIVVGVLIVVLVDVFIMVFLPNSLTFVVMGDIALFGIVLMYYHGDDHALAFTLLLGAVAFALVAGCEIVYLRDLFESEGYPRMNTVFKFYFQAWALLSASSGCALFFLFEHFKNVYLFENFKEVYLAPMARTFLVWLQRGVKAVWAMALVVLTVASLIYAAVAPPARLSVYNVQTQKMQLTPSGSLDGMTYLQHCGPPDFYPSTDSDPSTFCLIDVHGDYEAIRWINANIQGDPIIVEAADAQSEDYSEYALVSSFTGLPTIMGWPGHEVQWRNGWLQNTENATSFNRRFSDIDTIYTDNNARDVLNLMRYYHAEYLYVGSVEYYKYLKQDPSVNLSRFSSFMKTIYDKDGVAIYKLP